MLRNTIKYLVWALCAYGLYKAAIYYSLYKMVAYTQECEVRENYCALKSKKASSYELLKTLSAGFECIDSKQTWLEKRLTPLPKTWLNIEDSNEANNELKRRGEVIKC